MTRNGRKMNLTIVTTRLGESVFMMYEVVIISSVFLVNTRKKDLD